MSGRVDLGLGDKEVCTLYECNRGCFDLIYKMIIRLPVL